MKKNYIMHFGGMVIMIILVLSSCSDDKNLGDPMSETITISSVTIAATSYDAKNDTICLLKNGELQLSCTVLPEEVSNPNVQWTSSNESVATITQNGKITAKENLGISVVRVTPEIGFGPASATPFKIVKVLDHFNYIESMEITNVPVEEIAVGSEYQLNIASQPQNATFARYKWSSSNSKIATVDKNGIVSGIGKGKVTITATADDLNPDVPASTSVEIGVKVVVPITSVELIEDGELSQLGYGEDYQIRYNLTPEDATASLLTWTSDNEGVVTVDKNGKLHVNSLTNGSAVVTMAYGSISASVTVSVAEGRLWYSFANGLSPWAVGNSATSTSDGTKTIVQMGKSGSKYRGDLSLVTNGSGKNVTITPATYRYLAVKIKPLSALVAGNNSVGTIKFELYDNPATIGYNNLGQINSANNSFVVLNGSNISTTQPNILYYDLQAKYDSKNPTDWSKFTLVQLKFVIADYLAPATSYDLYWIRAFKTLDELNSYVNNENN